MDVKSRARWAARLATALGAGMLLVPSTTVDAQGKACSLATPEELQAALGAAVSGLKPQTGPAGTADICAGQTPTASIMLRVAKRSGGSGVEAAGIEAAKKMGAQVQLQTEGPITCSTVIPPKSLEQYGFNTTCSVLKN